MDCALSESIMPRRFKVHDRKYGLCHVYVPSDMATGWDDVRKAFSWFRTREIGMARKHVRQGPLPIHEDYNDEPESPNEQGDIVGYWPNWQSTFPNGPD